MQKQKSWSILTSILLCSLLVLSCLGFMACGKDEDESKSDTYQKETFISIWSQLPTCDPVTLKNGISTNENYENFINEVCGISINGSIWQGYDTFLSGNVGQLALTIKDMKLGQIYQVKVPNASDNTKYWSKIARNGDVWKYNVWKKTTATSEIQYFYYSAEINYVNGIFKSVKIDGLSFEKDTTSGTYSASSNYGYSFDSTKTDATRWTKTSYSETQFASVASVVEDVAKGNYTLIEVKAS